MSKTKQILTRISNLLDFVDDLLENMLDIRRELLRIKQDLNSYGELEDINGVRVYKGSDYTLSGNIKIGECLPPLDAGGNIVEPTTFTFVCDTPKQDSHQD